MSLLRSRDRVFVAGHRGMASAAIVQALQCHGFGEVPGAILAAGRNELDLVDPLAVQAWFALHKVDVVVLVAAKVGGIEASSTVSIRSA